MGESAPKILVIDDDPDFVDTVRAMLRSGGYRVITAIDGKQGLDRVREDEPDLIVLDIMMDSMYEGFSVMSTLRGTPEFVDYRDVPIVMVSAVKREYGSRFTLPQGGEHLQGDVYLDKPVNPKVLLETVARLLEAGA
ncbi:MAG: response regulator [Proteobacteria bacterium]|nr:response regulator [Pseudomonadota bacterium]